MDGAGVEVEEAARLGLEEAARLGLEETGFFIWREMGTADVARPAAVISPQYDAVLAEIMQTGDDVEKAQALILAQGVGAGEANQAVARLGLEETGFVIWPEMGTADVARPAAVISPQYDAVLAEIMQTGDDVEKAQALILAQGDGAGEAN
ncbi:hypothetical protein NDN08_000001 [Rhodosorus marinus]|uniref:Uncharacterized protein n=1 Tax=Rhodosorus marinus TaxID=101924 RepID=A0AAV8UDY4_9RHOD|nr:hypothetical protein NDN08_000001 [Rhodosorus marinus]